MGELFLMVPKIEVPSRFPQGLSVLVASVRPCFVDSISRTNGGL